MNKKLILIVEDEEDILELLEYTLQKENYETIGFLNVNDALYKVIEEENISLILMDRNLPGIEGTTFIQNIRDKGYTQPVIYLSAKDKDEDILEGFLKYADDYITKPFKINELKARINAVIKRSSKEIEIKTIQDITYISSKKKFYINDNELNLSHLEHDLSLEFFINKDILLSRDYLLEKVWKDSYDKKLKTVNVAINRLKNKINIHSSKEYIKAIRGEGYMF